MNVIKASLDDVTIGKGLILPHTVVMGVTIKIWINIQRINYL